MKTNFIAKLPFIGLLWIVSTLSTPGQNGSPNALDDALSHLPKVEFREDGPQHYVFICDYLNFDLAGNIVGRERVSGDYTRGLPDKKVRWNNVQIAQSTNADGAFADGVPQKYMEGFSYDPASPDQLKGSFFADFPADSMQVKTLVWDVSMFEQFARKYFDKLKLNEPFELSSSDVSLPGGKFFNRRPALTWVGVSTMNGKTCAVVQYEAFFNKLSLQVGPQTLSGRSDYWGTIWVSLTDKQIEKGTLNEGVLMGAGVPGQKQAVTIFRQATLCRR